MRRRRAVEQRRARAGGRASCVPARSREHAARRVWADVRWRVRRDPEARVRGARLHGQCVSRAAKVAGLDLRADVSYEISSTRPRPTVTMRACSPGRRPTASCIRSASSDPPGQRADRRQPHAGRHGSPQREGARGGGALDPDGRAQERARSPTRPRTSTWEACSTPACRRRSPKTKPSRPPRPKRIHFVLSCAHTLKGNSEIDSAHRSRTDFTDKGPRSSRTKSATSSS